MGGRRTAATGYFIKVTRDVCARKVFGSGFRLPAEAAEGAAQVRNKAIMRLIIKLLPAAVSWLHKLTKPAANVVKHVPADVRQQ